ncbi:MAG: hypothetical protein ACTSV1_01825 [Alphaproteobacteria bacterium]
MQKNSPLNAVTKPTAETGRTVEADSPELKVSLAKAMCRQYIMWPAAGDLPCEKAEACDKQTQCVEMAEGVLDYQRDLPMLRKISSRK